MKFNVTNIAYDFNDGNADLSDDYKVTLEEMQQITEDLSLIHISEPTRPY